MEQTIKPHKEIMAEADAMTIKAGVKIRGDKKYLQVKDRVTILRRHYALALGIDTTLLEANDKYVRFYAKITDPEGRIVGSGHAEELRGEGHINKTSALENAESSAVGRALASLGLHGGEYPSAEEMVAVERKTKILDKKEEPLPAVEELADDLGEEDNRGENHPSKDWGSWAEEQKNFIEKQTDLGEVQQWRDHKYKYLVEIKQENSFLYDILIEIYLKRKKELTR